MPEHDSPADSGQPLVPYVPAERRIPEFTARAVVLGVVMSVLFGMVNAYLGLKVGLTVSASIPSAVMSMAILRGILRRGTILENNIVHTIASAGESLAAGVVFTIPAFLFIGVDPGGFRIFLIGATAGLLGILMMIPLRHHLTIAQHGALPFPEGTACAQVLIAGDRGHTAWRPVFLGIVVGGGYQFAMRGLRLWRETVFVTLDRLHKMSFGAELTPIFLGVGYLIGARIAAMMFAGGALAWAVLLPAFDALGGTTVGALFGISPQVGTMSAWEIWRTYVRFVGAGGVACGGVISIVRVLPIIVESFRHSLRVLLVRDRTAPSRTEDDLPPTVVIGGTALLALGLWLIPSFGMGAAEALLAVVFAYFFVVVSARMVGLIGTTSQPVSGMTITALLATSFLLHVAGYSGSAGVVASLSAAVIVCVAVALSGDISQDLKCGALVGGTPRAIQLAEMIGVIAAALRAGWVLLLLHQAYVIGSEALPAPQAKLMATLAQGVMQGNLPWALLLLGAGLAGAAEVMGVNSLAFAIGLYLPVTTTTPLMIGGLIAARQRGGDTEPRTLLSSGLIAGDALIGILIAALVVSGWDRFVALRTPAEGTFFESALTIAMFAVLTVFFASYHPRSGGEL